MSVETQSFDPSIQPVGIIRSYARKSDIVREDDPANHVYEVVSGTVCTSKVLNEGRRQIAGFYFAGDMFGLEGAKKRSVTAEAITNAKIRIFEKRALTALASSNPQVADRLMALMTRELARKQDVVQFLSRPAEERIIYFLMEMIQRTSPRKDDVIDLPMSRQDIADYLGLTIETVSRILREFERRGAIKIKSYRFIALPNNFANGREKIRLNFLRLLRRGDPRPKKNCRNGLPRSKARLPRCLNSRLCLAGAKEDGRN